MLVTGDCRKLVDQFVKRLSNIFSLKDLGELHFFLGIEVNRSSNGMFLSQKKYVLNLLEKLNMKNVVACPTPMTLGKHNTKLKIERLKNPAMYRSLIGGLQYLTNTRPDLSYAVNQLSQAMSTPTTLDWLKAKRVLRYLKGTADLGLHIKPSVDLSLVGF